MDQYDMPNERSIYDLITSNNLDEIRTHLNPLTLPHRQSIISQMVENKTLLGHACELSFRDIVKYLLDECEADITEGYTDGYIWLTPLRVAVDNLDLPMLVLLIKRGVVDANKSETVSCLQHALEKKYFSIGYILVSCMDIAPHSDSLPDLSNSSMDVSYTYLNNAHPMSMAAAAATGDINRLKLLLADGVHRKISIIYEENTLCAAISNKKSNVEHFLLNYRVSSLKEHILALELCGAKFIVFKSDLEKGVQCLRKAIRIRTEHFFGVSDKFKRLSDLGFEFSCEEQLDILATRQADLYVQALIVLLRLLPPSNHSLQNAFIIVAWNPAMTDVMQAITILSKLAEFPDYPNSGHVSPVNTAIFTLNVLLRRHFRGDPSDVDDLLIKLRLMIAFIHDADWDMLLARQGAFYQFLYINLLKRVLYNIIDLQQFDLHETDNVWIRTNISSILQWHSDPYPTTLLHLAIEEAPELAIIRYLISCIDDINCTDMLRNTPMHAASLLQAPNNYLLSLVNLLRNAGGHIDAVNMFGLTPFTLLYSRGVIRNPLKFISLKCLAAKTIVEKNVTVPDNFSRILGPFINIHKK